jgi:uncharacterized membrane protein
MKLSNTYSITSRNIGHEIHFILGVSTLTTVISAFRLWLPFIHVTNRYGIEYYIMQIMFIVSAIVMFIMLYLDSVIVDENTWMRCGSYDVTNPQILTKVERDAFAERPVQPMCVGHQLNRDGEERPVMRRLVKLYHKQHTDMYRYSLDDGASWIYVPKSSVDKHRFQYTSDTAPTHYHHQ